MADAPEQPAREHPRPPKPEKTAEDRAAIDYLAALRDAPGEARPVRLPLACVVKVTDYENVPKANDAYAMVRVEGPDGRTWRLCVFRKTVRAGKNALFVSDDAALPDDARFRNPAVCKVKEKVYKFGFGLKTRRLLPHVKRHIYRNNCGVLYPVGDFAELKGKRAGTVCAALLHIDSQAELTGLMNQPKKKVFMP